MKHLLIILLLTCATLHAQSVSVQADGPGSVHATTTIAVTAVLTNLVVTGTLNPPGAVNTYEYDGLGGTGGGGNGGTGSPANGTGFAGTANTGGGGGGGGGGNGGLRSIGGNGGSGIVIVRYEK